MDIYLSAEQQSPEINPSIYDKLLSDKGTTRELFEGKNRPHGYLIVPAPLALSSIKL